MFCRVDRIDGGLTAGQNHFELFDVTLRDDAGAALLQFTFDIEFVGGLLLLAGLLTRIVSIPMMIIMLVALASAKWGDVDSLQTLLGFEEISYFVMFGYLAVAGPGPVSLDHLILKALRKDRPPSDYGA